jgi:hypothetical protein
MKKNAAGDSSREAAARRATEAVARLAEDPVAVWVVTVIHRLDPLRGVFSRSRIIVGPLAGASFTDLFRAQFPNLDVDVELTRLEECAVVTTQSIAGGRDRLLRVASIGDELLGFLGKRTTAEIQQAAAPKKATPTSLVFWGEPTTNSYVIAESTPQGATMPVARLHVDEFGFELYVAEEHAAKQNRARFLRLAAKLVKQGDIRSRLPPRLKKRKLSLFQVTAGMLAALGVKMAKRP